MSTVKFVSKNSNYMIVLKPGVEGNRAIGTHAVPGVYVKFQDGSLSVNQDSIIDMLRTHPSYGMDFLEIKEDELDPFVDNREESEPGHVIQEIRYGHAEKSIGSPAKTKLTPAMKKLIETEAVKMLPGLLKSNPKILQDIILDLAAQMKTKEEPKTTDDEPVVEVKKGPGRPPKV